ncbi:hypothetical protein [Aneurinibacillus aneurinilyticus]|uniref:Uncharacterized protein n=1 Tax=Aneurinibacillus aneurinilyticus ATCC 12856 TaxID=649747 RepID=U1WY98_ANEAE|nr:hypothetical protein [Aneurinibacillus aneurinilyticus]ERI07228.1 hypothetical protein HMPREF0083_04699 [Aneurinibacillus aneurinilyticus ATCC 12856]MED0706839.1 hypothetical protein [Aneurinibacillus aneurinilyticus]MED0725914.1 hypothetical protein [Aneurinibacillus aneurinilyticus]MED0730375.1 hypothetical protein [Aneurinibacillus aneurinilyticus]MED0739204.1 hypothetical protein [Aneurinibacillus aneurinilyticus]
MLQENGLFDVTKIKKGMGVSWYTEKGSYSGFVLSSTSEKIVLKSNRHDDYRWVATYSPECVSTGKVKIEIMDKNGAAEQLVFYHVGHQRSCACSKSEEFVCDSYTSEHPKPEDEDTDEVTWYTFTLQMAYVDEFRRLYRQMMDIINKPLSKHEEVNTRFTQLGKEMASLLVEEQEIPIGHFLYYAAR